MAESIRFYRDVLGFDLMAELMGSAAFLGAGGYHHHVGANVWHSRGAPPAPAGTARLRHATDRPPGRRRAATGSPRGSPTPAEEPEARDDGVLVRDPSGIDLLLAAAS